jgi:hypothetical protein
MLSKSTLKSSPGVLNAPKYPFWLVASIVAVWSKLVESETAKLSVFTTEKEVKLTFMMLPKNDPKYANPPKGD